MNRSDCINEKISSRTLGVVFLPFGLFLAAVGFLFLPFFGLFFSFPLFPIRGERSCALQRAVFDFRQVDHQGTVKLVRPLGERHLQDQHRHGDHQVQDIHNVGRQR